MTLLPFFPPARTICRLHSWAGWEHPAPTRPVDFGNLLISAKNPPTIEVLTALAEARTISRHNVVSRRQGVHGRRREIRRAPSHACQNCRRLQTDCRQDAMRGSQGDRLQVEPGRHQNGHGHRQKNHSRDLNVAALHMLMVRGRSVGGQSQKREAPMNATPSSPASRIHRAIAL